MKLRVLLLTTVFIVLSYLNISYAEEKITLSTFYPAPYGDYDELTVNKMVVGPTYAIPTNDGDLVVEGNVGIGTETPIRELDIIGDMIIRSSTNPGNIFEFNRYNTYARISVGWIAGGLAGPLAINVGGSERMRILDNGNVGIGTTSPGSPLEIVGHYIGTTPQLLVKRDSGYAGASKVRIYANPGRQAILELEESGGEIWALKNLGSDDNAFSIVKKTGEFTGEHYFVIETNGNVGIGAEDPGYKLEVVGANSDDVPQLVVSRSLAYSGGAYARIQANPTRQAILELKGDAAWRLIMKGNDKDQFTIREHNVADHLTILKGGNVGIGTTSPGYKLTVSGTAWCTSGAWSGSDIRWKENIETLPNPLEKILRLRGVEFDWKHEEFKANNFPEGRQIGIIAQELEAEFPELVTTNPEGYKAIAYDRLSAVLLEAIKSQQGEISTLKSRIDALESEQL